MVGRLSALQLVLLICAAQVLIQIGAFVWPALLPDLVQRWALSYGEAGWITGITSSNAPARFISSRMMHSTFCSTLRPIGSQL